MSKTKKSRIMHADCRVVEVNENLSVLYIAMQEARQSYVKKKTVNLDEALDMTGFGLFNILIILVSGGCLMCVILESMGMMFVSPAAQCDLELNVTKKGILNAVSFLGIVFSSNISGYLSDSHGRRNVLIISLLSSFVVTLISSFVVQDWLFIILRFLNGALISGASSTVYAFAGEFHSIHHRDSVISWISSFVAIGNISISGLAWLILPGNWKWEVPILGTSFRPWRLLVICYGLPSLVFGLLLLFFPESPKFLMRKGKQKETLNVLKKVFSVNKGKEKFPVTDVEIITPHGDSNGKEVNYGTFNFIKDFFKQSISIFSKTYFFRTITVSMLQFGTFALSSGLAMWYPEILNRLLVYEDQERRTNITICNAINHYENTVYKQKQFLQNETTFLHNCTDTIDTNVYKTMLISGSMLAGVYLIIGLVINHVGKKNLMISILVISAASGIAAQYVVDSWIVRILTNISLISSTSIAVINAIVVDIYSTEVRATALAVSLMFGRLGAVTGSHIVGPIFYRLCDYAFVIFLAVYIVLIILVSSLPIRSTKKSLLSS